MWKGTKSFLLMFLACLLAVGTVEHLQQMKRARQLVAASKEETARVKQLIEKRYLERCSTSAQREADADYCDQTEKYLSDQ